jgi:myo-inositol 2-dehydrogenase/D-chiro-inositol 1-dehydrogenase
LFIEGNLPTLQRMKSLRYGIIGTGTMGREHLRCVEIVDGAEVVAVADPYPDSLNAAREIHADLQLYDDYRRMLEKETLDAVVVATPNDTHADIVCDVLESDVHLLAEKPVATTLEDSNRIVEAEARSNRILQVGLELRHAPIYVRMRELIDEGRIGRVRQLWCKEFRGPWAFKVDHWITQRSRSGGTLVEKNCHHFDLFNWFAGERPARVAGFGSCDLVYGKDHFGIEPDVLDNAQVVVQYENGAVATQMDCLYCTGLAELEVGVIGTEGWLIASTGGQDLLRIFRRGVAEEETEEFIIPVDIRNTSHDGSVYYEHLSFADSIRNELSPTPDIEAGWWGTVVGLAAEQAVRESRIVEINDFTDP